MWSSSIVEAFLFSLYFILNCFLYWTHPNFQWHTFVFPLRWDSLPSFALLILRPIFIFNSPIISLYEFWFL